MIMETAIMMSFHAVTPVWLDPQNIKSKWTTDTRISEENVIRLGATQSGKNFRRYSASGPQMCS